MVSLGLEYVEGVSNPASVDAMVDRPGVDAPTPGTARGRGAAGAPPPPSIREKRQNGQEFP